MKVAEDDVRLKSLEPPFSMGMETHLRVHLEDDCHECVWLQLDDGGKVSHCHFRRDTTQAT